MSSEQTKFEGQRRDSASVAGSSDRLSVLKCRTLLGRHCGLTDPQILELRDALYDLANVAFESYKNGRHPQ